MYNGKDSNYLDKDPFMTSKVLIHTKYFSLTQYPDIAWRFITEDNYSFISYRIDFAFWTLEIRKWYGETDV
jgi:hypothetical protein